MLPSGEDALQRTMPPSRGYAAIVLYFRRGESVMDTVESIRVQTAAPQMIFLVDNCSGDGVIEQLQRRGRLDGVRVLSLNENRGYAGGMNVAARAAIGGGVDHLLFLTHEVVMEPTCVAEMVGAAVERGAAAVGPALWLPDGTVWSHGGRINRFWGAVHIRGDQGRHPRTVAWLDGACVLVRAGDFLSCGGFDEKYFLYWEDVDMSLRLAKRGPVVAVPSARAVQAPSQSPPLYFAARNRLLMWRSLRRPIAILPSLIELLALAAYRAAKEDRSQFGEVARGIRDGLHRQSPH